MNYYNEIKEKLIDNELYSKIKDYSKEKNRVKTYFEVGKLLHNAGKHYGEDIIGQYSSKLIKEVGKSYNKKLLFKMRQLYALLSNKKIAPLVRQLSWSHCLILLPIKNINEINYYINQVYNRNLTKRELSDLVKAKEYERLSEETKNKLIDQENPEIKDFVKNPIIIKSNFNYDEMSEKILKKLILENIEDFLAELGEGFCYIKNEYKIKLGDRYNYIDLLLYNIKYKCYVVIELKISELKKEHIGQIQAYMNYIDKNIKSTEEDNTVGIIIVKKDNQFVMEYCSDNRIITREYYLI